MGERTTYNYIEYFLPLTNSRGLGRFVRFDYRVSSEFDMPIIISPHNLRLGKPFLTRQGFYFLSDMDCVIRKLIPEISEKPTGFLKPQDKELQDYRKAANDCLFEYSIANPESRLTIHSDNQIPYVEGEYLQEIQNSQTGESIEYLRVDDKRVSLLNPDAVSMFEEIHKKYLKEIREIEEKIPAKNRHSFLKLNETPYDHEELLAISKFIPPDSSIPKSIKSTDNIDKKEKTFIQREWFIGTFIKDYFPILRNISALKLQRIKTEILRVENTYNPVLLNFYFSGLRSLSPITEFGGYYNVIEYFFETAALDKAKNEFLSQIEDIKTSNNFSEYSDLLKKAQPLSDEKNQIREVIKKYVSVDRIKNFFKKDISIEARKYFENFSHPDIQHLKITNPDLQIAIADRIYKFRNAVFHSKKTLKGRNALSIRPFSVEESQILKHEVLLVKMVAQEIIKQADPED